MVTFSRGFLLLTSLTYLLLVHQFESPVVCPPTPESSSAFLDTHPFFSLLTGFSFPNLFFTPHFLTFFFAYPREKKLLVLPLQPSLFAFFLTFLLQSNRPCTPQSAWPPLVVFLLPVSAASPTCAVFRAARFLLQRTVFLRTSQQYSRLCCFSFGRAALLVARPFLDVLNRSLKSSGTLSLMCPPYNAFFSLFVKRSPDSPTSAVYKSPLHPGGSVFLMSFAFPPPFPTP